MLEFRSDQHDKNCRYKREPEVNVKTMNIDEDADYSITPEWPADPYNARKFIFHATDHVLVEIVGKWQTVIPQ